MARNRRNRNRPKPTEDGAWYEKSRAVAGAPKTYTFVWKERRYTLPPADQAVSQVPAGVVMDALDGDGETAQLRLALAYLKASAIDKPTMDALRAMPFVVMSEHLGRWMRAAGVRPGESERSST